MSIEFAFGDIFADSLTAYGHGCNCAGAMGKGIAVSFREKWPEMYEKYRKLCLAEKFNPGDVFVWNEEGKTIFNLATQKTWKTKATMEAVEKAVVKMVKLAEESELNYVVLPQIGAGLGGLKWANVRCLLESIANGTSVRLVVCEVYIPGKKMGFNH